MASILRRILTSDEADYAAAYNCTYLPDCYPLKDPLCFKCSYNYFVFPDSPLPPSPPPPPPPSIPQSSSSTPHVLPYMISAVCALGVAFLILTTCTILLRQRWARRRRNNNSPDTTTREVVFVDELDRLHGGIVDHPIWHINTIGLQQSLIDQITSFKYKRCDGLTEGSDCSVCLGEFQDGEDLRLLPKCNHAFHLDCIDTWLRSHKNCPLCRAPVVNNSPPLSFSVVVSQSSGELNSSSGSALGEEGLNSHGEEDPVNYVQDGRSVQSSQGGERADDFRHLPIEGVRIAEILKRNRENRVFSDLGDNYRVAATDCQQPVRRSVSLDVEAASVLSNSIVVEISSLQNGEENSSKQQLNTIQEEKEKGLKRWHGNSMRLMKSSSIGRSLQKAPVSMKRSLSSGGKIFSSFRGSGSTSSSSSSSSKNQVSNLPV